MICPLSRLWIQCALALACLSPIACDSKHASDLEVDWQTMAATPSFYDGSDTVLTVEGLQDQSGIRLILPSYLPSGIASYTAIWEDYSSRAIIRIVKVPPLSEDPVEVEIIESAKQASGSERYQGMPTPVQEARSFDDTDVACRLEPQSLLQTPRPTPQIISSGGITVTEVVPAADSTPEMICHWSAWDVEVSVTFSWTLPEPIPSLITPEMREEAMKVVRSMIEHPHSP